MGNHKYNRPVSIIGVGMTEYGLPDTTPSHQDMSYNDLFAWAAQEAIKDAGISPKDIDFTLLSTCSSPMNGMSFGNHAALNEWIGLSLVGGVRVEAACASGYLGFDMAVNYVASGRYDIVLVTGVEVRTHYSRANEPNYILHPMKELKQEIPWLDDSLITFDNSYYRFNGACRHTLMDAAVDKYLLDHPEITFGNLDEAMNHLAIQQRWHASRNPKAANRKLFEEIAKSKNYDDVYEYMRSDFNPIFSRYLRMNSLGNSCNGAAACVVCSSDIAKQFQNHPIEVLGTAVSTASGNVPYNIHYATKKVCNEVYDITGVKAEEIDYLETADLMMFDAIESAEAAGYLPAGEGWKYAIENRTAWNGDKPMNTDGGIGGRGHVAGADGIASVMEAVLQMRGEAGERQVNKIPHLAMVRGFGGSHTSTATILKNVD